MAATMETHVQISAESGEEADETASGRSSIDLSDDGRADDDDEDEEDANAGWADAMAKILGKKTAESKNTILIKNKELDKMKEKEREEQMERKKQVDQKRVWEMMCREKPDVVRDRETERALQRTATRGVVQLFNAVRKHQKTIDDKVKEVGGSERKKAKILSSVSKRDFIDVLRRTEGSSDVKTEKDSPAADQSSWSVLREDYLMGATMKDWDRDSGTEEAEQ